MSKACELAPTAAPFFNNLGNALREAGETHKALAAFEKAVRINPQFAHAFNNLGNVYTDLHQIDEAIDAYIHALKIDPTLDHAQSNLGLVLRDVGRFDEAIACLMKAIELNPRSAIAFDNLGITLREAGRLEESVAAHEAAIRLNPHSAVAYSNLSIPLKDLKKYEESAEACEKAIALKPDYAEAYNNLGVARAEQERVDEAIAAYRTAIALRPDYGGAYTNLGVSLADLGKFIEGAQACAKAVALDPNSPRAHFNLGVALLQAGDFQRGWSEYEYRLHCRGMMAARSFTQPRWDGRPLDGRRIFLHSEQGIGDAIQFIRYVPMIHSLGGRAIVECHPSLHRIIRKVIGAEAVIAPGDALPTFDVHCPMLSLPLAFKTSADTIPASIPYLNPDPGLTEEWRGRMELDGVLLKVGLIWAGGSSHKNDRNRSMPLAQFGPLSSSRIQYYSIQRGPAATQADDPPPKLRLIDPTDELYDWGDTAAMVANLDLVITVDTAAAHLAGAMGKPVWTLLPFNADWRWMIERSDSPWYSNMRLFRQKSPGDWAEVITRVRAELREFAGAVVKS